MRVNGIRHLITRSWEKNRTEILALLGGGYPGFVIAPSPKELETDVPVFCYHEVVYDELKSDLDYLSGNGYRTIDADTFLDHLENRKEAPRRSVVLTFDDGSRNLLRVVHPLLREYRMKAVAFIATAFHSDENDQILDSDGNGASPLTWRQIKFMHDEGVIDFQCHTHSHRYLPLWPKALDLEGSNPEIVESLRGRELPVDEDFRLSKEILEKKLGKEIRHLAFPNFNGTQEAIDIGRSMGYRAFWWGVLPKRSGNMPGQSPTRIVRFKPEYLQRLPGQQRKPLMGILARRFFSSMAKMRHRIHVEKN